jgi:hypothetical protein
VIRFDRKIGTNRGASRLWIEGKHLVDAGFLRGTMWTLTETATGLIITADPNGKRKVSRKGERPVIDICGASLGKLASGFDRAQLTYRAGKGVIIVEGMKA